MSLDGGPTRWVTLVVAFYPDGTWGESLQIWTSEATIDEVLGEPMALPRNGMPPKPPRATPILDDMIGLAKALYHERIGPAYSDDDMLFFFYPFEDLMDMFDAIGLRLLKTDGVIPDFKPPNVTLAPSH